MFVINNSGIIELHLKTNNNEVIFKLVSQSNAFGQHG